MKSILVSCIFISAFASPVEPPPQEKRPQYEQFKARALNPSTLQRLAKETMGCRPEESGENAANFQIYKREDGSTIISPRSGPTVDTNPIPEAERQPRYFEPGQRPPAAAFAAVDHVGKVTRVQDQLGKVTLVFLFKPDCKYTAEMIGEVIRLQGMQQRLGVCVMPVTIGEEGWSGLARWRQKNVNIIPAEFPIYRPNPVQGTGTSVFGTLYATPTTFILDREGKVAWRMSGALRGAIWDRLNQILLEPTASVTTPAAP